MSYSARVNLAELRYDDRFVRELPGDARDDNRTREVLGACYSRVAPTRVARPELLALVPEVAALIDLDPRETPEDQFRLEVAP